MPCIELPSNKIDKVPKELKAKVLRRLDELIIEANKLFKRSFNSPKVMFYLRGTTAGKADLTNNVVILNHVLLVENQEEFMTDTIPHELAHLITLAMFGRKASAHGKEWKAVMRALGVEPTRTHSLDVSSVSTRHEYRCACKKFQLSTVRHNKAARGAEFLCPKCKHVLVLASSSKSPYIPSRGRPRTSGASFTTTRTAVPSTVRPSVNTPRPTPTPTNTCPTVRPSTPTTGGARLPSEAMLKYARDLAKKHKIMITPEILGDFERCRGFISMWAGA